MAVRAGAERKIHNAGRLMWGSVGKAPSRRRQGGFGAETPAFGDVYNIVMKIKHFYALFRLKFLLKNIFLISSKQKTVNDLATEHFSCSINS